MSILEKPKKYGPVFSVEKVEGGKEGTGNSGFSSFRSQFFRLPSWSGRNGRTHVLSFAKWFPGSTCVRRRWLPTGRPSLSMSTTSRCRQGSFSSDFSDPNISLHTFFLPRFPPWRTWLWGWPLLSNAARSSNFTPGKVGWGSLKTTLFFSSA